MINATFIPLTTNNSGRSCSQGSALYFRKSSIHCNSSGLITFGRFQERLTPLGNCHMGLSLVPTKRVPRNSKVPTPPLFKCQTPVPSAKSSRTGRFFVGFVGFCSFGGYGFLQGCKASKYPPTSVAWENLFCVLLHAGVAIYGYGPTSCAKSWSRACPRYILVISFIRVQVCWGEKPRSIQRVETKSSTN